MKTEQGQNWYQSNLKDKLFSSKCNLLSLNGHHNERSINVFSGLSIFEPSLVTKKGKYLSFITSMSPFPVGAQANIID
jgi:hypothetical protein